MLSPSPGRDDARLLRYPRVDAAERGDRILIVAPHVDDEAIGAGGYAIDAVARGAKVYVVFLTAGDRSRFSTLLLDKTLIPTPSHYLSLGRTRIAEARVAMGMIGVRSEQCFMLGYPDGGLRAMLRDPYAVVRSTGTQESTVPYDEAMSPGSPNRYDCLLADLRRVIAIAQPTTIIAPVSFDRHPDHSAAAEITDLALEDFEPAPRRLGYLVHSGYPMSPVPRPSRPLLPPLLMRSLSWGTYPLSAEVTRAKDALLRSYRSQRPYTYMLRSGFVRTNELFIVGKPEPPAVAPRAASDPELASAI